MIDFLDREPLIIRVCCHILVHVDVQNHLLNHASLVQRFVQVTAAGIRPRLTYRPALAVSICHACHLSHY